MYKKRAIENVNRSFLYIVPYKIKNQPNEPARSIQAGLAITINRI